MFWPTAILLSYRPGAEAQQWTSLLIAVVGNVGIYAVIGLCAGFATSSAWSNRNTYYRSGDHVRTEQLLESALRQLCCQCSSCNHALRPVHSLREGAGDKCILPVASCRL